MKTNMETGTVHWKDALEKETKNDASAFDTLEEGQKTRPRNGTKVETVDTTRDEKPYTKCGTEFGTHNEGKTAMIARALYGLKIAGTSWRKHCTSDDDVWLRTDEEDDGTPCYEYIMAYTNDVLVLSTNTTVMMDVIDRRIDWEPDPIGEPKTYLDHVGDVVIRKTRTNDLMSCICSPIALNLKTQTPIACEDLKTAFGADTQEG